MLHNDVRTWRQENKPHTHVRHAYMSTLHVLVLGDTLGHDVFVFEVWLWKCPISPRGFLGFLGLGFFTKQNKKPNRPTVTGPGHRLTKTTQNTSMYTYNTNNTTHITYMYNMYVLCIYYMEVCFRGSFEGFSTVFPIVKRSRVCYHSVPNPLARAC